MSAGQLAGIYNDIRNLLARLTDARAAKIDNADVATSTRAAAADYTAARAALLDALSNLDAAITSRAPADTALSNADWTTTRALRLDTTISSRLDSVVKSMQSNVVAQSGSLVSAGGLEPIYHNITVSSVNIAKSLVLFEGGASPFGIDPALRIAASAEAITKETYTVMARMFTSTILRLATSAQVTTGGAIAGRWKIIEFN